MELVLEEKLIAKFLEVSTLIAEAEYLYGRRKGMSGDEPITTRLSAAPLML